MFLNNLYSLRKTNAIMPTSKINSVWNGAILRRCSWGLQIPAGFGSTCSEAVGTGWDAHRGDWRERTLPVDLKGADGLIAAVQGIEEPAIMAKGQVNGLAASAEAGGDTIF